MITGQAASLRWLAKIVAADLERLASDLEELEKLPRRSLKYETWRQRESCKNLVDFERRVSLGSLASLLNIVNQVRP